MNSPKFCSSCGNPLTVGSRFCAECGTPISTIATAPTVADESEVRKAEVSAPRSAPSAPKLEAVAPSPAAAPKSTPKAEKKSDKKSADAQTAAGASETFVDPIASILAGTDEDNLDDHLGMPDELGAPEKKPLPLGMIALGGFAAVMIGLVAVVASSDELTARFECNILGRKAKCITEEDKLWEIEQAEKREEIELMTHHYGGFDLAFSPEKDVSFTLKQMRYEEGRDDFVKRVREGESDTRVLKETKVGVYSTGKSTEGVIKGRIRFATNPPDPVTFKPEAGKELVLPLSLAELPLLEREQADGNGKRLTAEDIKKIEEHKNEVLPDGQTRGAMTPEMRVRTVALSTWVYEVELSATGYEPRKVVFYEPPAPPDMDLKKLEKEQGITFKPFKRRPDGRFVIDNASFDLLPKPRTIWTRYIQLLKELHCLRLTREYQGRSEQGKKDAEELIWEQKSFSPELRAIAHQNDDDPEWKTYHEEQFKGYQCPKIE